MRTRAFPELVPVAGEGAAFAAVPLIAEERTLGVFALGFDDDHVFDDDEIRFLTAVADQCAQALARALLYDRERHERDRAERDRRRIQALNKALQTSLLPPALPLIPGVELEARYQPALAGLEVGGDFYDVFDTGGDWAIVIGDVCGKGPEAAAVTAVARWTIRSVAMDIRQPTQVLRKVNEALVHQQLDDRFCTIAYARVVPTSQGIRVSVCRGGHPAPLVVRADGEIEPFGTAGSLIGILPEVRLWEETTQLHTDDALVFYTDGVTEARRGREQFGDERLRETLAYLPRPERGADRGCHRERRARLRRARTERRHRHPRTPRDLGVVRSRTRPTPSCRRSSVRRPTGSRCAPRGRSRDPSVPSVTAAATQAVGRSRPRPRRAADRTSRATRSSYGGGA